MCCKHHKGWHLSQYQYRLLIKQMITPPSVTVCLENNSDTVNDGEGKVFM